MTTHNHRERRPFDLEEAVAILSRTPATLDTLLRGLPDGWIQATEGGETWSPYDVIGHLNHCERADWIPRTRIILEHGAERAFDPFDRFAQFTESKGKTLEVLLDEFKGLREESLRVLAALNLKPADMERRGRHPAFGEVTLGQLLATWTAHDLGHIAQVVRAMAKQYTDAVGPWHQYLSILGRK